VCRFGAQTARLLRQITIVGSVVIKGSATPVEWVGLDLVDRRGDLVVVDGVAG
jgi:hypothetical protein